MSSVAAGRVVELDILADPERLAKLDLSDFVARPGDAKPAAGREH